MSMSPTLQALLARLDPAERVDFGTFATAIYDARFTGPATFHWLNGRLQQVDLGDKTSPIRFAIAEGVDNRGRSQAG